MEGVRVFANPAGALKELKTILKCAANPLFYKELSLFVVLLERARFE